MPLAPVANRLFRHRRGIASIRVLAWFVTVCRVFAPGGDPAPGPLSRHGGRLR
ncbi:hypothetical protein H1235_12805 [Pseudoxanthomonas sp. NC8]|nr:hypothetical protein H1235_12805 [Pseudoxanthomonas sp. NC8]